MVWATSMWRLRAVPRGPRSTAPPPTAPRAVDARVGAGSAPHARAGVPQESFVLDGTLNEDDSEFAYRIALQTEDGAEVDSVQVAFRVAYSVREDVRRWLPAALLARFKLLSPPDAPAAHTRWEALPPLPA